MQELKFDKKILNNFNYKLNFAEPININKEIRHILFSVNDYKRFMNFEKISENYNIIGGAWFVYGSDNKINYIKD